MSTFKLPDAGIEIDIERISLVHIDMMRATLRKNTPGEPVPPKKEVRDAKGNVTSSVDIPLDTSLLQRELAKPMLDEKVRASLQADLDRVNKYLDAKNEWEKEVNARQWEAVRLLYAKHLKSPVDQAAIERVVKENQEFGGDLRQQVRDLYAKHNLPFNDEYLDRWIYLWCVCVTSAYDSGVLNSWMQTGSQEARQVMRQAALFPV